MTLFRNILGIETSCDDTAAALLSDGKIIADRTTRQILHEQYGGVVPELASRAHERLLEPAVKGVLKESNLKVTDIDAIAVTNGPGLSGALLVGVSFAKGLASGLNVPLIGVNHLEGHLWSSELTIGDLPVPFLGLLVSGGHTIMVNVKQFGQYEILGNTRDDAVGELFDKVGRMLGFTFPAGENIDNEALSYFKDHKTESIKFPRTKLKNDPFGFSFSGLKTAVLYHLQKHYSNGQNSDILQNDQTSWKDVGFQIPNDDRQAICAGLMAAVGDVLISGMSAVCDKYEFQGLVVGGGVSASRYLRARFSRFATERNLTLNIPPIQHCTDNGSMIAYAGFRRLMLGQRDSLDLAINPSANLTDQMI